MIQTLLDTYLANRQDGEVFVDTYERVGHDLFKEAVYATDH